MIKRQVKWKALYYLYRVFCHGAQLAPGVYIIKTRRALWGTVGHSQKSLREVLK